MKTGRLEIYFLIVLLAASLWPETYYAGYVSLPERRVIPKALVLLLLSVVAFTWLGGGYPILKAKPSIQDKWWGKAKILLAILGVMVPFLLGRRGSDIIWFIFIGFILFAGAIGIQSILLRLYRFFKKDPPAWTESVKPARLKSAELLILFTVVVLFFASNFLDRVRGFEIYSFIILGFILFAGAIGIQWILLGLYRSFEKDSPDWTESAKPAWLKPSELLVLFTVVVLFFANFYGRAWKVEIIWLIFFGFLLFAVARGIQGISLGLYRLFIKNPPAWAETARPARLIPSGLLIIFTGMVLFFASKDAVRDVEIFRSKGYVKQNLHNIYLACKAYWAENGGDKECGISIASKLEYGFVQSDGVTMKTEGGTESNFSATAQHELSSKAYRMDANGNIGGGFDTGVIPGNKRYEHLGILKPPYRYLVDFL